MLFVDNNVKFVFYLTFVKKEVRIYKVNFIARARVNDLRDIPILSYTPSWNCNPRDISQNAINSKKNNRKAFAQHSFQFFYH